MEGNVVPNDQKNDTSVVKLRTSDIEWLMERGNDGESPAAVLSRLRSEHITLQKERGASMGKDIVIEELEHRITGLEADIEKLIDATPTTALTSPSEQSQLDFGGDVLKDTMDAVKDACADEESCVKTALHLIDTKANLVNSQNSRDHDRDERDKDRKLKQDLAGSKAKHEKDLALIKKGIVHEADLEGVVFLGEHRHKSAKAAIEEQKEQARRESDADKEWDAPEGDVL